MESNLSDEERKKLLDSIPLALDSCKENIHPRRQGRSVATLTTLFEATPAERERILQQGHDHFQHQLEHQLDLVDDPLQIYLDYLDWTIQHYPQGQNTESNLVGLLKSATDAFKNSKRYKSDPRYLKVWIEYVDWVLEPKEIFLYLMKQGIGQDLALFYEEYASYYEKLKKYDEASEVYKLGIKENAEPITRLIKSYETFKGRVEEKRRRGIQQKEQRQREIQMESLRNTGHRTMLGQKLDSHTRISYGPNTGLESRPIVSRAAPVAPEGFSVFVESTPEPIRSSILPSNPNPVFQPTPAPRRENQRPVQTFAGTTLIQSNPPVLASPDRFEVYQDPDPQPDPTRLDRSNSSLSVVSTENESSLAKVRKNPTSDEQIKRKRSKIIDPQPHLEKRFNQNIHLYLDATNSKGGKELIAVNKHYHEHISFEEARYLREQEKKDQEESISNQDDFQSYFEKKKNQPKPRIEYTEETLAAMESIGELFNPNSNYTQDEEEDLTWNSPYQTFKPIHRPHINENQ